MELNQNPPKLKIREIEFRLHAHATESLEKIQDKIDAFFPIKLSEDEQNISQLTGTFGNSIYGIEIKINRQKNIKPVLQKLSEALSNEDKLQLEREVSDRLDEKYHFYFRISKQSFIRNQLTIAKETKDVIQVIIAIHNTTPYTTVHNIDICKFFRENGIFIEPKIQI